MHEGSTSSPLLPLVNETVAKDVGESTSHSPPSIESIAESLNKNMETDPTHEIDTLIKFMDEQLYRIKVQRQEASTSSSTAVQIEDVSSKIQFVSQLGDKLSTEAGNIANSEIAKELGSVAFRAVKAVGESHWVFLGLSVVACAIERFVKIGSNMGECRILLEDIVSLAKEVKKLKEVLPEESEKLRKAVEVIVEGAVMCFGYMEQRKVHRYLFAGSQEDQLRKTRRCLEDIAGSLSRTAASSTYVAVKEIQRQVTQRSHQSLLTLLTYKPEGIDDQVEKVKKMLDMNVSNPALAVVLCGFGGVGKSTLAASVIQDLDWTSTDLKFCKVKINTEATDRVSHIVQLQQSIILDLGGQKHGFNDPDVGRSHLHTAMENKSCFLFIDNVVDKYYIEELLPEDFSPKEPSMGHMQKSKVRILVTCRESNLKPILHGKKITYREHRVNHLSDEAAQKLLQGIILSGEDEETLSRPGENFDEKDYMERVAKACKGVPLLLSIFGKYLAVKREADSYQQALVALLEGHPDSFTNEDKLRQQLFFVYDQMDNDEAKDAFLDICVYFNGWDWDRVGYIVDKPILELLRSKMLLDRSDTDTVVVHDILRLLGEEKARGTRLTNYSELDAISGKKSKLEGVKGIVFHDDQHTGLITVKSTDLDFIRDSLRVLHLGDWVTLHGPPSEQAFPHLRYLHLGDVPHFPFKYTSKLKKLTYFHNKSKAGMDVPQLPSTLKFLCHKPIYLDDALESFYLQTQNSVKPPQHLKLPASLVALDLGGCTQLPKSFHHLSNLEHLILDKCDMESLPNGFGKLTRLKRVSMKDCRNLTSLAPGFGSLKLLTHLNLQGCDRLHKLPDDFTMLTAVKEVTLGDCNRLSALPEELGILSSLQKLDISGCTNLQQLPESLWGLPISSLTLGDLHSLNELCFPPHTTENVPCLTSLTLSVCISLTTLPDSFLRLANLQTLKIARCIELEELPDVKD